MKPSVNKLSYMLHLTGPEDYYLTLLPFKWYPKELFHLDYVSEIVRAKQSAQWKNCEYTYENENGDESSARGEKGFRLSYGMPEYGKLSVKTAEDPVQTDSIVPESMEYLVKIVEYCREHDIVVTWIVCPMTELKLVRNYILGLLLQQLSREARGFAGSACIAYQGGSLSKFAKVRKIWENSVRRTGNVEKRLRLQGRGRLW